LRDLCALPSTKHSFIPRSENIECRGATTCAFAVRDTELRTFRFSFPANGVTVDSIDRADALHMAGAGEAGGTLTGNATRNGHLREAAQVAGFAWFANGRGGEHQAELRVGSGGNAKLPASVVVSGLVCLRRTTI
jgi:hypothetical protein